MVCGIEIVGDHNPENNNPIIIISFNIHLVKKIIVSNDHNY
jgi:hypothetical protein